jgi:hypothetical protein
LSSPPATESSPQSDLPEVAPSERRLFWRYMRRRPQWLLIPAAVGLAFFAFAARANPVIGLIFGLATGLIALSQLRSQLRERIESEFFASYAAARGLTWEALGRLPEDTPLPHDGSDHLARHLMRGRLPGDIDGILAHDEYKPGKTTFHFTVVTTQVGGAEGGVKRLCCQPREWGRFLDPARDLLRFDESRIAQESERLAERCVFFIADDQDENQVRQLLSPRFIVWLTEKAPDDFGFELDDGTLTGSITGYLRDPSALDRLCETTAAVARHIRSEAAER